MSGWFTTLVNCRLCESGALVDDRLVVSDDTGKFLNRTGYIGGECVDLDDRIVAPGFLELHTNGVNGFHFTHFDDAGSYAKKLEDTAQYYVTEGVTGFYATIPTVSSTEFQKILPSLKPSTYARGASLLGAHVEGPYLAPEKKGAHNAALFAAPSVSPSSIYGSTNLSNVKLVTVAPELPSSSSLITTLAKQDIRVSLGHSNATFTQGLAALQAGATGLTHTLNAMPPLHHRDPGLAGLISLPPSPSSSSSSSSSTPPSPYYSLIADGHHLHPTIASLLFRANPSKALLITDSIELAGLPDGLHPGHAQIPHPQRKAGTRATLADGTDTTLVGGCISLQHSLRNLMAWTGCGVAEAVRCVTENVAAFMGDGERGRLETGRRADFVVLDDEANLLETWVGGVKVWERKEED